MSVAVALVGVSTAAVFSVTGTPAARAAAAPGSTERASVRDETGAQSKYGAYQQELSADGNAVVFTSDDQLDDLAPAPEGSGGYENVYVRDLDTDRTVMISRGQFHRPEPPIIDLRGERMLDLSARGAQEPPPVMGEVPPNQDSYQPTISADGRYVAFVTTATNIVLNDSDNDQDIIVCDRDPDNDGVFDEDKENGDRDYRYFRVTRGDYGDGSSTYRVDWPRWPKISDDGSRLVWRDRSVFDGYYRDRVKAASLTATPTAVAAPSGGVMWLNTPLEGRVLDDQSDPDISGDGRYAVLTAEYRTPTDDPYDDEPTHHSVMRVELATGAFSRVDTDRDGKPISTRREIVVEDPVISRDGSVVAFDAEYKTYYDCEGECWLPSNQPNVYVVHVDNAGEVTDSAVVSRDNFGDPVNGFAPGLSADGRFVSFVTDNLFTHDGVDQADGATCLVDKDYDGPTPGADAPAGDALPPISESREVRTTCQVVVRDMVTDRNRLDAGERRLPGSLASPGTGRACAEDAPEGSTCGGDGNTTPAGTERSPTLSADGSRVAYESDATNLVPGVRDTNEAPDVFVRTFRPELRAAPDPLDFGEVVVGEPLTATVTVSHVGVGPLSVTGFQIEGDEFAVTDQTCVDEGTVLQQAETCLVEVEFTPSAERGFEGLLRLVLPGEREFTVRLVGTGVPEPTDPEEPGPARFAAGTDPLDFGERLIRSTGPDATVTVTNQGESPMTVAAVTVEPPAARLHYSVLGNTCAGTPVAPGESCAVTVRFVPTESGNLPGVLSFVDDAPGSPHLVGLTGSAPTPTITVSPAVSPPNRVVTVTGVGFAPNQPVLASFPLAVQTAPVTVAADGTFRAPLLILPKAGIGTRVVVARVNAFPEINAESRLLVVTPTVGPAEFVVRG